MALAGDLKVKGLSKEENGTCEPIVQPLNEPEKLPLDETMVTEDKRTNADEKTSPQLKLRAWIQKIVRCKYSTVISVKRPAPR